MSSRESWSPEVEELETDPLVTIFPQASRSRSVAHARNDESPPASEAGEREPLLGDPTVLRKKPFYRARPLWLVPFAITAALVRGMTLAPRVEVFTQLACSRVHHSYNHTANTVLEASFHYGSDSAAVPLRFLDPIGEPWDNDGSDNPTQLPSPRCASDPAVQASAARVQTMYTTTMGLLSAVTTGWWGGFGERYGRTKVLAISTFGLFLTDLTFILASTPSSPFSSHGNKLLIIAPVIEGLLGGWSTLQSGTSAYISDCTSSGSRASVFSRFTGVSFLGFSVGPIIGGWLIRHPIAFLSGTPHPGQPQGQSVTTVFWVAVICSFINFCLMLFVFPESVTQEQRDLARAKYSLSDSIGAVSGTSPQDAEPAGILARVGVITRFLRPLAIFLPRQIFIEGSTHKRKDWSLTLLASAMFGYMLSAGLYQIKYLYGKNVYDWGPEQLSYYISFMGGGRALFLLFVFPLVISTFKPKSNAPKPQPVPGVKAAKPKPTKAHLAREIKFDLRLTRISLCIDILANTGILFAPAPAYKLHSAATLAEPTSTDSQFQTSQALFVASSWIASWGAGLVPAVQSLALCVVQARALLEAESGAEGTAVVDADTGSLFGALAVLQATGQMILGPMLFGLIYSGTVGTYPKAVFATAMGLLFVALVATLLVRSPVSDAKGKSPARRRRLTTVEEEAEEAEERGRSRASKDLRVYGSTSEAGSPPQQGGSSSGSN
ncbi:major facilitator superfamily domain-containing protein [Mycena rosella]|uniref:Major facilitator superfamily domain-containing protein n=1 Tax=Mycena rosella TaxID=1033263 RepID=A0AAD7G491_MYCRO|nr:major facilitator superfamily domain-containing protein [Mycena rosella]